MTTPLLELLHSAELARVSAKIERVALSSIRLRAYQVDETLLRLGTSKCGGFPKMTTPSQPCRVHRQWEL